MEISRENLTTLIDDYNNQIGHQQIKKREFNDEIIAEGGLLLYWYVCVLLFFSV